MDSATLLDTNAPKSTASSNGNTVAVLMAFVAALGPLVFGYTLGFSSPSSLPMMVAPPGTWTFQAVFSNPSVDWNSDHTSGSVSSAENSLFGSIVNVGAMIGALIAAPLADSAGRKLAIATSAVPFIAAWLLIGLTDVFAAILVGRLLSGIAVGIASMCVPLYISETAPASLRGGLGAVNQFAVTGGILLVYLLGFLLEEKRPTIYSCQNDQGEDTCPFGVCADPAKDTCDTILSPWRVLAIVGACISGALLVCALLILPETPNHLVAKGKTTAARKVLSRLRSSEAEAEEEYEALLRKQASTTQVSDTAEEMGNFAAAASEPKVGGMRGLFSKGVRKQFFVGCMLMVFQQFSGINAVIFFSSSILQSGGIDDPNEGGLIVMAVQVLMTGVAVLLMDRAGRRMLLLISLTGMTLFTGTLAAFYYNDNKPAWLSLTSLVGYIVFFSLGLGAIPWLIMGEIFPGHVRALAASIATLLNWTLSFIVTETFASLLSALGPSVTFTIFGGVCALGICFVVAFVPETKGKTFEEIEALFR